MINSRYGNSKPGTYSRRIVKKRQHERKPKDVVNGRWVAEWLELKKIKPEETKTVNGRTYKRRADMTLFEDLGDRYQYVPEPILTPRLQPRVDTLTGDYACSLCGREFKNEEYTYYSVPKYKLCPGCSKLYEEQVQLEKTQEIERESREKPRLKRSARE